MNKRLPILVVSLTLAFVFGLNLLAQETTEVTVKVKKDGKIVKDTTYQFEDEAEAKHAIKMMEVLSGEEKHMKHYNYTTTHSGEGHSKAMVFISEDGEKTVIKEIHGDSLVWHEEGDHPHKVHVDGEHVIVMKSGDGEHVNVWVDEDGDHDGVKKKNIKVIVSGDEEGTWTVESNELVEIDEDENVKVIVIKKDGDDDDEVEVEVIEKKKKVKKK